MARWFLEPGHTAVEFSARHMMVTNVRGHFKNVHGFLDFDEADPRRASVEVTIDARGLWTGPRSGTRTFAARTFSMSSIIPRSATWAEPRGNAPPASTR